VIVSKRTRDGTNGAGIAVGIDALIHPERFATRDRLRAIQILNVFGCALIAAAVGVLLYDLGSVSVRG